MQAPDNDTANARQIITFYSYKGGTGRSMALANVAWILASNGKTVLTIDWDLEAPGMHRYFAPFLDDPKMAETEGLIDQLYRYISATSRPPTDATPNSDWVGEYADVQRYAEPLNWRFQGNGRIDLLGPGQQDKRYGERVNLFDWQAFYGKFGGAAFFEAMLKRARKDYDYILIDSRTGVSDTSGICTVHLPDALAVFYTLNDQSIEGASAIAKDALDKRRAIDGDLKFRVFPVATRIELAEKKKLETRRKLARAAFEPVVDFLVDRNQLSRFFGDMEVLYDPYYAYEEILATVADQPGSKNSVLASFESLATQLTNGAVTQLAQVSETRRAEAQTSYETLTTPAPAPPDSQLRQRYDVFVSHNSSDAKLAERIGERLSSFCKVFVDASSLPLGTSLDTAVFDAIQGSRLVLALIGDDIPDAQKMQLESALQSGSRVIPIWLSQASLVATQKSLPELTRRNAMTLSDEDDLDLVSQSIRDQLGLGQPKVPDYQSESAPQSRKLGSKASSPMASFFQIAKYGLAALVFLALTVSLVDRFDSDPNERSNYLAVQAAQTRDTDPVLSLLLAREAVIDSASDFAVTALRESLRTSPEIRRYVGQGQAFVTASMHNSSGYIMATDVAGDTFVFSATDDSTEPVFLGRTREETWGPTDRAGRPTIFTVQVDGAVTRWGPLDGNGAMFEVRVSSSPQFAFGPGGGRLLQRRGEDILTMHDVPRRQVLFQRKSARSLPSQPWSADGSTYVVDESGQFSVYSRDGDALYSIRGDSSAASFADIRLNTQGTRALIVAGAQTGVYGDQSVSLLPTGLGARRERAPEPVNVQQTSAPPPPLGNLQSNGSVATAAAWTGVDAESGFTELVAVGFDDGRIGLWLAGDPETATWAELRMGTANGFVNAISLVDFDSRGSRLGTASGREFRVATLRPGVIRSLSTATNSDRLADVSEFRGHTGDINDLDWGNNGKLLVTASEDGTVRVWDVETATLSVDVPAEELLRIAEARLPRTFTVQEAKAYDVPPDPERAPTELRATQIQQLTKSGKPLPSTSVEK
ncbi:MAG: TIR domain-containing protein [Gammaproteobacteria bacterium]